MTTAEILVYGLLLIPFAGTLIAGYAKLRVGPFLGITVALGAASAFMSYILLDFQAALLQFAAVGVGALLFFTAIGILGERFTYRSPMLLLAAVALFPLGLVLSVGEPIALIVYGIILVLNFLFAIFLAYLRRNSLTGRKGKEKPKDRFLLTIPTIVATVVVGLLILARLNIGAL